MVIQTGRYSKNGSFCPPLSHVTITHFSLNLSLSLLCDSLKIGKLCKKKIEVFCINDCLSISCYNKENRKDQKLQFDPTGAVIFTQRHTYIKNPVGKIVEFRDTNSLLDVLSLLPLLIPSIPHVR